MSNLCKYHAAKAISILVMKNFLVPGRGWPSNSNQQHCNPTLRSLKSHDLGVFPMINIMTNSIPTFFCCFRSSYDFSYRGFLKQGYPQFSSIFYLRLFHEISNPAICGGVAILGNLHQSHCHHSYLVMKLDRPFPDLTATILRLRLDRLSQDWTMWGPC